MLLGLGLRPLPAQEASQQLGQELENTPVLAIRHQPEVPQEAALEPAALERIVPLQTGQPYSSRKIRESIERLFATGRFADIQVDARREPGGVVVSFLTKGRYFVGAVRVRGVPAPPSEALLRATTRLQLGQVFSDEDLPAAVEGLRRALETEGYFQSQIVPRPEPRPETQQVNVTFEVQPGERARFGNVVVTGAPVFPADQVIRQTRWKSGKSFTSKEVQDGLARLQDLYRRENYLEASLRIGRRTFDPQTRRVDLELEVAAGPRVEVSVTGADLSRSRLARLLPIFEERTVDEDLLREGERNLRNYFESEGYFDATVRAVRQMLPDGNQKIEYQVELGRHEHLEEIQFSGNQYFRAETLQERLRIEPASLSLRHGRFSSGLLEQDLAAIRALYQANGFSQAQAVARFVERGTDPGEGMIVHIVITEGPQVLIGEFAITGNRSFPQEQLEAYINTGSGQPYSESVVASDRDNLLTFYFNEGFPEARFTHRTTPSEDGTRVHLGYSIEEGEREYIRHVYVSGLENTRRGVVNRQLQFRDGEPLSQGQMIETQRRLYDLGIFSQVGMAIQNPEGSEPGRTVLLNLEEARRYTVKIGLGVDIGRFGGASGDVTDVEGKTEISPNISFEIARLNVGGRPHTASLRTRFSTLQKRAGLTYTAPRFLNYSWLNVSAIALFDETRDVRTFSAQRLESALQFESKLSRATTLIDRYTFRRVKVDTSSLRISPDQIPLLRRPVLVGMLSQTWLRDTRDNPTDARQGLFQSVDFGVAAKQLGSETSFLRFVLQNSSYHPVRRRLTLARSFQFGLQTPFGKGRRVEVDGQSVVTREIPIAERFFAGGGNSHRGFGVNQAGPRDPQTGFAVGGNVLLFNSVELRFPVWKENISGVMFHDVGNTFARVRDLTLRQHQPHPQDFRYLVHAAGLGLRYRTPVGPARFDLGYNLNPTRVVLPTGSVQTLSRWQFLFSIGQSF
ncbi:MAG: outer membrane protein assembly factor BamA [Acidobacteria bacterium RIFCSPLOWO2_02_FULL_61_28]|nr:MAG: outer membrane protein assembly factor BamA [Acidobacteria bacterium RIFCSPLOWO2_02_FULL_61_28]